MRHGNYNLLNRNLTVLVVICLILFSGCQEGDDLTDQSTTSSGVTATPQDTVAPSMVSTDPTDQAMDVSFDVNVTATFNREIDPSSDLTAFLLIADGNIVPGNVSFSWKTATYDPISDLTDFTLYTAVITSELKDLSGDSLHQGPNWEFTTALLKPIANAGVDIFVYLGYIATLNGSGSSDPYFQPLTYDWTIQSGPMDSTAVLSDPTSMSPTLMADVTGDYEINLVVSRDQAKSAADQVIISVTAATQKPIANAGADMVVFVGDTVILDGSNSTDPYSLPLTYNWTFQSRPTDSTTDLSDPTSMGPTFVADVSGDYEINLVVSRDQTDSTVDQVTISATSTCSPDSNACTLDSVTWLIWQDNDYEVLHNNSSAVDYCDSLNLGGYSDWRLPDKDELIQLKDHQYILNNYDEWYWSSTTDANNPSNAWAVYFGPPQITAESYDKSGVTNVRCVRGGP